MKLKETKIEYCHYCKKKPVIHKVDSEYYLGHKCKDKNLIIISNSKSHIIKDWNRFIVSSDSVCENCGKKLVAMCVNKKCDWSPLV